MKNWRTTTAGIAAILTAVGDIAHGISTGNLSNLQTDILAIVTGIGLIFASDAKGNQP